MGERLAMRWKGWEDLEGAPSPPPPSFLLQLELGQRRGGTLHAKSDIFYFFGFNIFYLRVKVLLVRVRA